MLLQTLANFMILSILILIYCYFLYPILLHFLSKIGRNVKETFSVGENFPTISLVIAAFNEEKVIGDKLINCLGLDYPSEKISIWVASDGSTDFTNDIVKGFAHRDSRIQLGEFARMGKSGVINLTLPKISSDLVIFSDANTLFEKNAIRYLVAPFSDIKIGCVCGRLVYRNPGEVISGKGESFYWRYETTLKKLESKFGYVSGANGAIYAIRRHLFEPLPKKTINDDFMVSMKIVEKGYKSIYAENAVAFEDVAPNMKSEFSRHVRDGAGHYIAIFHLWRLLNPMLGRRSFIYWSHRILRWVAPFLLIYVFAVNLVLAFTSSFLTLFFLQIIFYSLAILGFFIDKYGIRVPIYLYIPFYFCNLNLALICGFFNVIRGVQKSTWVSTAR